MKRNEILSSTLPSVGRTTCSPRYGRSGQWLRHGGGPSSPVRSFVRLVYLAGGVWPLSRCGAWFGHFSSLVARRALAASFGVRHGRARRWFLGPCIPEHYLGRFLMRQRCRLLLVVF